MVMVAAEYKNALQSQYCYAAVRRQTLRFCLGEVRDQSYFAFRQMRHLQDADTVRFDQALDRVRRTGKKAVPIDPDFGLVIRDQISPQSHQL